MASITKHKRKCGTVYRAQIRIKRPDGSTHSEAKTFSARATARRWAEQREEQLREPDGFENDVGRNTTIGDLIEQYLEEFDGKLGRSKRYALEAIRQTELGETALCDLTSQAVVSYARARRNGDTGGSTINQDLVFLQGVLDYAYHAWSFRFDTQAVADGRRTCRATRITHASKSRDRRPTDEELRLLLDWFDKPRPRGPACPTPYADIIRFAVASARRQSEITRLRWEDLNEERGTILVRDLKHPDGAQGNHERAALTKEALAIIQRQPSRGVSRYIFPANSKTVGTRFREACKILGIEDLRFHDLRHEATSRLFEAGYQIHEVASFTLHRSWATLQRYTQLRPEDVALRT